MFVVEDVKHVINILKNQERGQQNNRSGFLVGGSFKTTSGGSL